MRRWMWVCPLAFGTLIAVVVSTWREVRALRRDIRGLAEERAEGFA
jgi:hypothetical protein